MILSRFYDEKLAQASYLFGCARTGEALVIDPNRSVEQYIAAADRAGLKITAVTETHIHADFVSGSRELAQRTGAQLYLSDEGDSNWKYRYAPLARATLMKDGFGFMIGNVRIEVMHTPGHTPEHLSFVVSDTAGASAPMGIVTGDFVFAGDVGRPDLLEKAAHISGASDGAARTLFRSLQRFRSLPDYLQIWPGHGAGSACGKGMSAVPQSTVGYEKLFNWAFQVHEEDEFVRLVLSGQPDPPKYFGEMKRINKLGPALLGGMRRPVRLPEAQLRTLLTDGALVVDLRSATDFSGGHLPGTINIPLNRGFTTWAGWLLPYDREIYLLLDQRVGSRLDEAIRDLAMIGLDRIGGYFGIEALEAWETTVGPLPTVRQIGVEDLASLESGGVIVDVRNDAEWEEGHLEEARHIPLGWLPERMEELPRDRPILVHCQSGARSAIAASLLTARGFTRVANFSPGFAGWQAAGKPISRS